MQILLKQSKNEANKFHFDLINYKEFNKNEGFKVISDMSQIESEAKFIKEKNEELSQKVKFLEENNFKLIKSLDLIEQEKLVLESSLKTQKNQNENAKLALGEQIDYCKDLQAKLENQQRKFNER